MTPLSLACSPCPNDIHLFGGLLTGAVSLPGFAVTSHLHDVEQLNQAALAGRYDVSKLSCHGWFRVAREYRLLPVGAALGFGVGPLLVTRDPAPRGDIASWRVLLPGPLTTATLLFRLAYPQSPQANQRFASYETILPAVARGEVEAGVVIHEGRFNLGETVARADLGAWWEEREGLPLPLGCCVIRASLGRRVAEQVTRALRASLALAQAGNTAITAAIAQHAQELSPQVINRHIATFVTPFTHDLGEVGMAALERLKERAEGRLG